MGMECRNRNRMVNKYLKNNVIIIATKINFKQTYKIKRFKQQGEKENVV